MNTAEYASTRALIQQALRAAGWTDRQSPCLASKVFQTAVGPREALAYLTRGDGFNRTITGVYRSEGRNALEPHSVLVPVAACDDDVLRLAQAFATQADSAIGETYAMRLARPVNPSDDAEAP